MDFLVDGFYPVNRGWMQNEFLSDRPYCYAAAWLWLVGQARFKDEACKVGRSSADVKRGQASFSLRYLAHAWRWREQKEVRRFLDKLVSQKMVALEEVNNRVLVTILNYSKFNDVLGRRRHDVPATQHATDSATRNATDGLAVSVCKDGENAKRNRNGATLFATDSATDFATEKKTRVLNKTQESEERDSTSPSCCPPGGGSGPPESGQEGRSPTQPDLLPTAKIIPMPSSDADRAFEMWNETAKHLGLPTVRVVCEGRRQKMNARLKEIGGISAWREALEKVGQSPFLLGDNDRGWKADITFMLQQSSLAKVLEGAYTGMGTRRQSKPSALDAAEALERRWGIQGSKF